MTNSQRTTESEFYNAIRTVLIDAGGSATISYVRRRIPSYVSLTSADCTPSSTREGEQLWEQQIRNIVCHRDCEENPIKVGEIYYTKRRLTLADYVQRDLFDNDNEVAS